MTTITELANVAHESPASKNQPATFHATTKLPGASLSLSATVTPDDTVDLSASLTEIVAQKTKTFSDKLLAAFNNAGIDIDDSFILTISQSGQITAAGPYKDRIEEFLHDNPDLAKELKEIAALSALVAMQEAHDLYQREKEEAKKILDPIKREQAERDADMHHTMHLMAIGELSGGVAYSNGMFSSAALDYIRAAAAVS